MNPINALVLLIIAGLIAAVSIHYIDKSFDETRACVVKQ